jgi:hypothetical protein
MTDSQSTTVRDNQTGWKDLDWPKLERIVSRAQARIARAALNGDRKAGEARLRTNHQTRSPRRCHPAIAGETKCLSRMLGNSHVRFLGGDAAAMPRPYPTCDLMLWIRLPGNQPSLVLR